MISKCNDLLMWAHYADDHKGLCVGFDTELWPFCTSMDVTYSKNYPVINRAATTPGETLTKAVLTKAECWNYEDEWRIVMRKVDEAERSRYTGRTDSIAQWTVSQRGPGSYTVPSEAIVQVIFGSRMSEADKGRLASGLRARQHPVSLLEARLNRSEFQIDIVPYSPAVR